MGVGVRAGPTFLSNPEIPPGWDANPHPPILPPSPLQHQRRSRREEADAAARGFLISPEATVPLCNGDNQDDSVFLLVLRRAFFTVVLGTLEIVLVHRVRVASGIGVAGRADESAVDAE